ncbi:hypothetical protein DFR68_102782 [Nocardia mexicana]|uniref:Uncharacterized protein n=1 Tax=Nocardia mexicana TaxID=279262 RepID=A0A370HCJ5_9NOCA|nr:hypothetical protein DFR68_102782 [Nocardia mexicana]
MSGRWSGRRMPIGHQDLLGPVVQNLARVAVSAGGIAALLPVMPKALATMG